MNNQPTSPSAATSSAARTFTSIFGVELLSTIGRTHLSLLMVFLFLIGGVERSWGQIFNEDFTGLTLGNLGTQNSWVQNGSGTDVQVANTTPISFSGYSSGGGNYITIAQANGFDPHKLFSSSVSTASPSTFFYSFLVNVNSASTTALTSAAAYVITLRNSVNTAYLARFFIAKDGSNNLKFGISAGGGDGSGSFGSGTFSFGGSNTYLIVVRYDVGASTDNMYLWVNPSLASEPIIGSAEVSLTSQAKPSYGTAINSLMIHQRSATISAAASIDGFRVSNAATSSTAWTNLNASSSNTNYYLKSGGLVSNLADWGTSTDGMTGGPAPALSSNDITWNVRNNAAVTLDAAWTLGSNSKVIVGDGTNACNFTIPAGFAVTGTVDASAVSTLTIANAANPTLGTINATSTIAFTGASAQTIPAATYGNLSVSTTGGNATAGGAIVANTSLTISSGSTFDLAANTLTGTTLATSGTGTLKTQSTSGTPIPFNKTWSFDVDYNGTGAQTIIPGIYNNLLLSTARTGSPVITLGNGTIAVGGAFTVTATGIGSFSLTNSVVDFTSASSQTIPAISYRNINNTGNGPRVLPNGTVKILNSFSPGGGNYTIGTSTVEFNGTGFSPTIPLLPVASGPNYYNMIISGNQTWTLGGTMTVGGDFSQTTGILQVNLNTNAARTFTVQGNFNLSGGQFDLLVNTNTSASATVIVNGSTTTSGASSIRMEPNNNTAGIAIFQTTDFTTTSTSTAIIDFGAGANSTGNEFRVSGNFSKSGTGAFYTTGSSAATGFVFNKSGVQTFSYTGTASDYTQYVVNSVSTLQLSTGLAIGTSTANPQSKFTINGVLDAGANVISGGSAGTVFLLNSGATLKTAVSTGVTGTITMTGTKTYDNGANYEFAGSSAITNTNFSNTTMDNLTISNSNTTTLGGAITVNGNLALSAGTLASGGFNVSLGGNLTGPGTFNGSGKITMTGTGKTISNPVVSNLEINSGGTISCIGNPNITGNLTLTGGTLHDGGFGIAVSGNILGTGTHTSGLNGEISMSTPGSTISGVTLGNLQLYQHYGIYLTGDLTVTGELFMNNSLNLSFIETQGNTLTVTGTTYFPNFLALTGSGKLKMVGSPISGNGNNSISNLEIASASNVIWTQGGNITGNLTLNGTLNLAGGPSEIVIVHGNILGTGSQTNTGRLRMTGAGATISGATMSNLELNNAAGFSLTGNPTITSLNLMAGKLTLGSNNATVGSFIGANNSRYVISGNTGNLIMNAPAATTTTFPIGASGSSYDPVTLNPTSTVPMAVNVKATTVAGDFPGTIQDYANVAHRLWDITPTGTPGATVMTLTNGAADYTPTTPVIGHYNGSTWDEISATYGTNTWTATTSTFSPFGAGNEDAFSLPPCTPPAITGEPQATQTVCNNATPTNLVVTATGDGLTYEWFDNGNTNSTMGGTSTGDLDDTYTPSTASTGTKYYYCVVTGTCGTATSIAAEVIVQDISDAPVVTGPICPGVTSVSGTSSEADGTTITLYVNTVSVGTTTVTGGAWTKTGLTPLISGDMVDAKATASGECQSALSSTMTVISPTGDYRSSNPSGGPWNLASSWDMYDGCDWVPAVAAPNFGANTITIRAGHTITINSAVTVDQVTVEAGGTLVQNTSFTLNNGTGDDLTIDGAWIWTFGAISLPGNAVISPTGTLTMSGVNPKYLQANVTNNGIMDWQDGVINFFSSPTLTNNGTWNITGTNTTAYGDSYGTIVNNGIITKTSPGFSDFAYVQTMTNSTTGTINCNAGNFRVGGAGNPTFNNAGALVFSAGGAFTINGGMTFNYNAGSSVSGTGTFNNDGTLNLNVSAVFPPTMNVTNTIVINGVGDLTINSDFVIQNQINGPGLLIINANSTWVSGNLNRAFTVSPSSTLTINTASTKNLMQNLTNNGTIVWQDGLINTFGTPTLTNNGTWNITGNNQITYGNNTWSLINSGIITKTSVGTSDFSYVSSINNSGTINGNGGTLGMGTIGSSTFTNTGTISLANGAFTGGTSMTFNHNAGAYIKGTGTFTQNGPFNNNGGTIAPGASPGILTMNGAQPFSATSTLSIELLNDSGPGTGHDQVLRNSNLTLAGVLNVSETGSVPEGVYTIIQLSAGTISGSFSSVVLPPCYTLQVNSMSVTVTRALPVVTCPDDLDLCINDGNYVLNGQGENPAGGSYSGDGVTSNTFNTVAAGLGAHTITYTYTAMDGCVNTCSFVITVHALPTVSFTGLASSYCINASDVTLTGNHAPDGTFTGSGITDNMDGTASFSPAMAGVGMHSITYEYIDVNGCLNTSTQNVTVDDLPMVTCPADFAVCTNSSPLTISGATPSGGTYSGPGVINGNFDPALAGLGPHTITYSYTSGQCTVECMFDITVEDLPSFSSCPIPVFDLGCNPDNLPSESMAIAHAGTVDDGCGAVTVTASASTPGISNCVYTQTWYVVAEDEANNTVSCQVDYTWTVDLVGPTFANCPGSTIYLGCNPAEPTTADAIAVTGGATDGCGGTPVVTATAGPVVQDPMDDCSYSQVFTVTALDACGNSSQCLVTYGWIVNLVPPSFSNCPVAPINLGCNPTPPNGTDAVDDAGPLVDPDCQLTVITDVTGGAVVVSGCQHTQQYIVTGSDGCNTTTCTINYAWTVDMTGPVFGNCPGGALDLGCNPATLPNAAMAIAAAGSATDGCGSVTMSATAPAPTINGCSYQQVWTVVATDACGNTSNCPVTYTWTIDTEDPVFTACPANPFDLGCNAPMPSPGQVIANAGMITDNCGQYNTMAQPGTMTQTGCLASQPWTVTAIDDCGNDATCTVTYTWTIDNDDPQFSNCPVAAINLGCNPTPINAAQAIASAGTVTDGCNGMITVTATGGAINANGCVNNQSWTVTATDACGHTDICQVDYTWTVDLVGPTFANCPGSTIYLGCNPAEPTTADAIAVTGGATDGCGGTPVVTATAGPVVQDPMDDCSYSQVFTVTALDACGNSSQCLVTYGWIVNLVPPSFSNCPVAPINLGCNPTPPNGTDAVDDAGPLVDPDCQLTVITDVTGGAVVVSGCQHTQQYIVTGSDGCNTTTCTINYAWTVDMTGPVFGNCPGGALDLGCNPATLPNAAMAIAAAGSATDGCGSVTMSATAPAPTINGCSYQQVWTVVATDACGNTSNCPVTYTWTIDTEDPVFTACPVAPINLGCNAPLPSPGQVVADAGIITDNCGQFNAIAQAGTMTQTGCTATQPWTVTATDDCGNDATCTVTYTWTVDLFAPEFTACPNMAINLGNNPPFPTAADAINDAGPVTDDCGAPTMTAIPGAITGTNPFSQSWTVTATDACGLQAICVVIYTWTGNCTPVVANVNTNETFCDIQEAIDDPQTLSGHLINIPAGVYSNGLDALLKDLAFAPGNSPGCVNIVGDMILTGGDDLNMEVNGPTACTDYDQFDVDGMVTLGGADLVLALGYAPTNGTTYTLIDNDLADAVSGMFSQGTSFNQGGYTFNINYSGGDGNDVTMTVCSAVKNLDSGESFCSLQSAINDAQTLSSHTLQLQENISEGLVNVNKDVIIDGNGKTLTSTSGIYGIEVAVPFVVINNLTLQNAGTYGIITDCDADNLTITNTTVQNCGASGFAINGSDNVTLTSISALNNVGNGVSVSNCNNLVITGITTSGNAFMSGFSAGIGLFTSGVYCLPAGINGFTLTGVVSIAEPIKVYSEKAAAGDPVINLSGASIQWAVGVGALTRTYWPSKVVAYAAVDVAFEPPYNYPNTLVYVAEIATENFYVDDDPAGDATPPMLVQTAVNFEVPGKTIFLESGSFNERVTLDKSLTLEGAGAGATILDGTGLAGTGNGITLNTGITNVTIKDLTVRDYAGANPNASAGIYGVGGNNNLTITDVDLADNVGGSGFYANGPIDNVLMNNVDAHGHTNINGAARGIVIWNGHKSNITITNCEVYNNNCCGIELQDGSASGVTMTGNNVHDNWDNGIGIVGLDNTTAANLVGTNTVTDNGRFGIEIKNPNGDGTNTVVSGNTVTQSASFVTLRPAEVRDIAGIAVFRRGLTGSNVDVPNGVRVIGNTVSGYIQDNGASVSEGFGIVIEGTNHTATGNTINNNDVGLQQQAGHTPYPGDGNQNNIADTYFGRGNSPMTCGNAVTPNTYSGNGVNTRSIGVGAGLVINTNTSENFCSIQAAIDDANTIAGHTITVAAGTFVENVIITKGVNIIGSGQGVTIVKPSYSDPNCGGAGGGSLCPGSSNIMLVRADNVSISNMTLDGDNTSLTSTVLRNGADIDARNGIITDHNSGVYNNLVVNNVEVKNIYLRGVYASTGGTFTFSNNTVTNVAGDGGSIAMFNFGGAGSFTGNTVSLANDGIASNHSKGTTYTGNIITLCSSGIHTDNNGSGGGVADLISGNSVSNGAANS